MKSWFIVLMLCYSFVCSSPSYALTTDTHSHINESICGSTQILQLPFGEFLKQYLNLEKGLDQEFGQYTITEHLKLGGIYEDLPPDWYSLPYVRSFRHFHDPISNKGYKGLESSVLWAQDTDQFLGKYSWQDARRYFYDALIASGTNVREQNYADCFRALGQQMHLIQDASVPAHVRNDGHVVFMYEDWVECIKDGKPDEKPPRSVSC